MKDPNDLNRFLVVNQNTEPVVATGKGAEVFDQDGRAFIDLECGATSSGERFMKNLGELQKKQPILGDVRGKGLMIGLKIVDPGTRSPTAQAAKEMERSMLKRGVLISTTGVNANVLRITPPLVVGDAQIDRACAAVEAALVEAAAP